LTWCFRWRRITGMGRKRLEAGKKRQRVELWLTWEEAGQVRAWLAGVRGEKDGRLARSVACEAGAASIAALAVSPWTGGALCGECVERGANVHCRVCGPAAKEGG